MWRRGETGAGAQLGPACADRRGTPRSWSVGVILHSASLKDDSQPHPSLLSHRLNVNMLKMIQLGLTFSDHLGNLPRINNELCVWQFNFR